MDFPIETAVQYGALGFFVAYLIYDRQKIISRLQAAIEANTKSTDALCALLEKK